ncbi:spermatogenesis associated 6-like protein [Paramisgurnus dabryanus]|uniref:spermatogenesis associated 6-like protein n=1 Tax=Paramisgurnus dabryanus TaxID=90735 RepID=UPI0031F3BC52
MENNTLCAVKTMGNMSHKAIKVVVELHLRAVTCPGVHLPDKDDMYISVCLMNQYRKSECLPAVFPLLIREKMKFEKVLKYVTDPAEIAEFLQCETVKVELIQMIPPSGRILASFEEDARSFLFPEPKLVPSFSGVERELLMTRDPAFPGISPRLEFSTKTTISQISNRDGLQSCPARAITKKRKKKVRQQGSAVSQRHLTSPPRQRGLWDRHQVQINDDFCDRSSRSGSPSPHRTQPSRAEGIQMRNVSSSWVPDGDSSDTDNLLDYATEVGKRHSRMEYNGSSSPSHSSMESQKHNGSLLGSPNRWEEVQERVQSLLISPKAVHRLACGATDSEIDEVLIRRAIVAHSCPF